MKKSYTHIFINRQNRLQKKKNQNQILKNSKLKVHVQFRANKKNNSDSNLQIMTRANHLPDIYLFYQFECRKRIEYIYIIIYLNNVILRVMKIQNKYIYIYLLILIFNDWLYNS